LLLCNYWNISDVCGRQFVRRFILDELTLRDSTPFQVMKAAATACICIGCNRDFAKKGFKELIGQGGKQG